jgi:hypothetical protein
LPSLTVPSNFNANGGSSGTSGGQQKLLPSTAEELDRKVFFHAVQALVRNM